MNFQNENWNNLLVAHLVLSFIENFSFEASSSYRELSSEASNNNGCGHFDGNHYFCFLVILLLAQLFLRTWYFVWKYTRLNEMLKQLVVDSIM